MSQPVQNTPILKVNEFEHLLKDYRRQGNASGELIDRKTSGKVFFGHGASNTVNFPIFALDTDKNASYAVATNKEDPSAEKELKQR